MYSLHVQIKVLPLVNGLTGIRRQKSRVCRRADRRVLVALRAVLQGDRGIMPTEMRRAKAAFVIANPETKLIDQIGMFLTHLAAQQAVAAATWNQALMLPSALAALARS